MGVTKMTKIAKKYMNYCAKCGNLSFQGQHCEVCGSAEMTQTPKKYGLTNLACISMSVMDFEAMKQEFEMEFQERQIDQPVSKLFRSWYVDSFDH